MTRPPLPSPDEQAGMFWTAPHGPPMAAAEQWPDPWFERWEPAVPAG